MIQSQFRAVATRSEKRTVNYRAMVVIASLICLDDDLGPETPDLPGASDRRRRELAARGLPVERARSRLARWLSPGTIDEGSVAGRGGHPDA